MEIARVSVGYYKNSLLTVVMRALECNKNNDSQFALIAMLVSQDFVNLYHFHFQSCRDFCMNLICLVVPHSLSSWKAKCKV